VAWQPSEAGAARERRILCARTTNPVARPRLARTMSPGGGGASSTRAHDTPRDGAACPAEMAAPGGAVTRPTSTSPCSHPGTGRWELVFLAAAVVGVILGAHPTPCGEARQSAHWWTDLAERRPVCLGPEHVVRTTSPPRSHQVTAPTPPWCCPLDDGHLPQGARCAGTVDLSSIRSVPPLVEYPATALFVQLTSCQVRVDVPIGWCMCVCAYAFAMQNRFE